MENANQDPIVCAHGTAVESHKITVQLTCTLPNKGYRVELTEAVGGFNPTILLLTKQWFLPVDPPKFPESPTEVVTTFEKTTTQRYKEVHIVSREGVVLNKIQVT